VALTAGQVEAFGRYRDELLDWNRRVNLTAIREPSAVERLHFVDSLACLLEPVPEGASLLDVGAGAGFPGLPLKIARPDLRLTLLEATGKKARFLEHVVSALALAGVSVVNERAETYAASGREAFDFVVARALAGLAALLELTLPFCRVGGVVLAPKKGAGAQLRARRRAARDCRRPQSAPDASHVPPAAGHPGQEPAVAGCRKRSD
jgi:16S rRNA (guanine527-N7)-methyltransferase